MTNNSGGWSKLPHEIVFQILNDMKFTDLEKIIVIYWVGKLKPYSVGVVDIDFAVTEKVTGARRAMIYRTLSKLNALGVVKVDVGRWDLTGFISAVEQGAKDADLLTNDAQGDDSE